MLMMQSLELRYFRYLFLAPLLVALISCGDSLNIKNDSSFEASIPWWVTISIILLFLALLLLTGLRLFMRLIKGYRLIIERITPGSKVSEDKGNEPTKEQHTSNEAKDYIDDVKASKEKKTPSAFTQLVSKIDWRDMLAFGAVGILLGYFAASRCGIGL